MLLGVLCMCLITSCSSEKKKAIEVVNQFWSAANYNHLDSLELLYPAIQDASIKKSGFKHDSYEMCDVLELGENRFEIRGYLHWNDEVGSRRMVSLLLMPNEAGEYYIYDSRYLRSFSKDDRKNMLTFGFVEDDSDIFAYTTDQQAACYVDSIYPTIKEQVIDSVLAEIARGVKVKVSTAKNCSNEVTFYNNTPYNLSKITLIFRAHYKTYHNSWFGYTDESIGTWNLNNKSFLPNTKVERTLSDYNIKPISVSISRKDAWKLYQPTGEEYQSYIQSISTLE